MRGTTIKVNHKLVRHIYNYPLTLCETCHSIHSNNCIAIRYSIIQYVVVLLHVLAILFIFREVFNEEKQIIANYVTDLQHYHYNTNVTTFKKNKKRNANCVSQYLFVQTNIHFRNPSSFSAICPCFFCGYVIVDEWALHMVPIL